MFLLHIDVSPSLSPSLKMIHKIFKKDDGSVRIMLSATSSDW